MGVAVREGGGAEWVGNGSDSGRGAGIWARTGRRWQKGLFGFLQQGGAQWPRSCCSGKIRWARSGEYCSMDKARLRWCHSCCALQPSLPDGVGLWGLCCDTGT
jgi:hypothetical protein